MHAVRHFPHGVDVRHAGFGGGEIRADVAAVVAGQPQAVGEGGLRFPPVEDQDQVVLLTVHAAPGGIHLT
ncbi:hypothetical protein G6F57_023513 [Rhizopus arrhizus]|nr:hypothetical protein G6F57_023513 [Rhizopus arrhizus]